MKQIPQTLLVGLYWVRCCGMTKQIISTRHYLMVSTSLKIGGLDMLHVLESCLHLKQIVGWNILF